MRPHHQGSGGDGGQAGRLRGARCQAHQHVEADAGVSQRGEERVQTQLQGDGGVGHADVGHVDLRACGEGSEGPPG